MKAAAVILAGAAMKGGFTAGAIQGLVERGVPIRKIVGTSAGALNGAIFALGVRRGQAALAAHVLVELWRKRTTKRDVLDWSIGDLFAGRGLSDHDKVYGLLEECEAQLTGTARRAVSLTLVVAPLNGRIVRGEEALASDSSAPQQTSYERAVTFDGVALDAAPAPIFRTAVASASFPLVFTPYPHPDHGPCVDGGIVNNAPIKHALKSGAHDAVDTVIVITPTTRVHVAPREPLRGLALVGQLADMLINERLQRDLKEARETNDALARLERRFSGEELEHVKADAGLGGRRRVRIVEVRPPDDAPLVGGGFSGLDNPALVASYIEAGRDAAARAMLEAPLASSESEHALSA